MIEESITDDMLDQPMMPEVDRFLATWCKSPLWTVTRRTVIPDAAVSDPVTGQRSERVTVSPSSGATKVYSGGAEIG